MKINKYLTPYNHTEGNINRIKYIVIHYVGATGGAEANCKWYAGANRNASAHYYVDFDGSIWQSVEDKDIAWHCGAKKYIHPECRNTNSIGIELCVRNKGSKADTSKDWYFEDNAVVSAIELTKELMKKYNVPIENVIRHHDVTGKICPNPYVYNHTKHTWEAFKSALVDKKAGWTYEENGWKFYLGNTNNKISSNWYCDNRKWVWFDEAGNAIHDTWLEYNENWYAFDSDCYMKESDWYLYKDKWFYLKSDGIMAKNAYVKSKEPNNNNYYYLNDVGEWDESRTTENPDGEIVI